MLARAIDALEEAGVAPDAVTVMPVPGAFELPLAAMALAKTRRYACVVALGVIVRGETPHFDYIAAEAASGLQLAAIETGVPVAFGVLTVETVEQAEARIDRAADAVRSGARDGRRLRAAPASARAATRSPGPSAVRRPGRAIAAARIVRAATLGGRCPRSAQSAGRSPGSGTTAPTRWWRRTAASIRTSSGSGCS